MLAAASLAASAMAADASGQARSLAVPQLECINVGEAAVPAAPYFSHLLQGQEQPGVLASLRFPLVSRLTAGTPATGVPVFEARWMAQPVFIVGADGVSIRWLERHQAALRRMGAIGIVLSAANEEAFKAIQRAALGPAQGQWLERHLLALGIRSYPVLIGLDGLSQAAPQEAQP